MHRKKYRCKRGTALLLQSDQFQVDLLIYHAAHSREFYGICIVRLGTDKEWDTLRLHTLHRTHGDRNSGTIPRNPSPHGYISFLPSRLNRNLWTVPCRSSIQSNELLNLWPVEGITSACDMSKLRISNESCVAFADPYVESVSPSIHRRNPCVSWTHRQSMPCSSLRGLEICRNQLRPVTPPHFLARNRNAMLLSWTSILEKSHFTTCEEHRVLSSQSFSSLALLSGTISALKHALRSCYIIGNRAICKGYVATLSSSRQDVTRNSISVSSV